MQEGPSLLYSEQTIRGRKEAQAQNLIVCPRIDLFHLKMEGPNLFFIKKARSVNLI